MSLLLLFNQSGSGAGGTAARLPGAGLLVSTVPLEGKIDTASITLSPQPVAVTLSQGVSFVSSGYKKDASFSAAPLSSARRSTRPVLFAPSTLRLANTLLPSVDVFFTCQAAIYHAARPLLLSVKVKRKTAIWFTGV